MKIRLLVVMPVFGSAMYVLRPAMVSTRPDGVPSCTAPLRQQELIPTFSDMVISVLGMGLCTTGRSSEGEKNGCTSVKRNRVRPP
jgi:hypothetical protein